MTIQIIKSSSKYSWYKNKVGSVIYAEPYSYNSGTVFLNTKVKPYNYILPGTRKLVKGSDCIELTHEVDILC